MTKKYGTHSLCYNYRTVIAVILSVKYPFRRIDDILRTLGKAKFFSALDARYGFWRIPMMEDVKKK